jgi:hypothetical protein
MQQRRTAKKKKEKLSKGSDYSAVAEQHYPQSKNFRTTKQPL